MNAFTYSDHNLIYISHFRQYAACPAYPGLLHLIILSVWWSFQSCNAAIPYLGYAYPQRYEPGHLGVSEKNWIMAEKSTHIYSVKTRYTLKVVKLSERYDEWRS